MEVVDELFVDTSAWFAIRFEDDVHHADAMRVVDRLGREGTVMHTTDWVLSETIALLHRRDGRGAAREVGEAILRNPLVRVHCMTAGTLLQAWERFASVERGPSLVDCSSFVVMEEFGLTRAFAFDDDFTKAGLQVERA